MRSAVTGNRAIRKAVGLARKIKGRITFAVQLALNNTAAWSTYLNRPETIHRRYEAFRRRLTVQGMYRQTASTDGIEIIVSSYNHGRYLDRTLKSIALQTYPGPILVTVVDNGSTDNTQSVLRSFSAADHLVLNVISLKRNIGMSGGFNTGVEAARSELVCLLCGDDYLVPNFVDEATRTFRLHQDIVMLGGGSTWFESDEQLDQLLLSYTPLPLASTVRRFVPSDHDVRKGPNSVNMSLSSLVFFKGIWRDVGKLEPNKRRRITEYDDRDFELRVCAGYPVGISESPFMFYRVGSSNWSS